MNHQIKRLFGYLVYLAAFGCLILIVEQLGNYYQEIFRRSFQIPFGWVLFVTVGVPFMAGLLLALPQFVKIARQAGAWKVDWIRLIVLGFPGLLFVLAYIAWMVFPEWMVLAKTTAVILGFHQSLIKVAGLLLGFVLLNSFYKLPDGGCNQGRESMEGD